MGSLAMVWTAVRRIVLVSGVVLLGIGGAACDINVDGSGGFSFDLASGKAQDEWTRTYDLDAGALVEIVNVNGRITAEPGSGGGVEVRAERIARASTDDGAREHLKEIEMREEVSDTRVRVEVRAPRHRGFRGHEVRWTVRVPKGVNVDLRTTNGSVRLTGLEGEIRARTTNGGVTGKGLRPTVLDASVTNGGVDIEVASALTGGTFELEATNGGVALALPAESKADINARCTNGGIRVSGLELELQGEQTRRRVQGRLNGGGARVNLATTNGGVRLTRAAASS
jgi:hypothetical protein